MRLGMIAVCTATGLGYQGKMLSKMLSPKKILVPDISDYNGYEQHQEWYPDATFIKGFPTCNDIEDFVKGLDVILVTESAYNDYLYPYCRSIGVKTINVENWEFFGWQTEGWPLPDAFISPSMWHLNDLKSFCDKHNIRSEHLHHPVDRNEYPFRKIHKAKRFIHSAGRSAAHDRAGTFTVIESTKYIESDVKVAIHFQGEQGLRHQLTSTTSDYIQYITDKGDSSKIDIIIDNVDHPSSIYNLGDVYVQPRRYGGNNLCGNEALSCGLPTIMTDISPNNQLLPKHWLVPAEKIGEFSPRTTVDIYQADPRSLAAKIDWFASLNEDSMRRENAIADKIASSISWQNMQSRYQRFIESVVKEQ